MEPVTMSTTTSLTCSVTLIVMGWCDIDLQVKE